MTAEIKTRLDNGFSVIELLISLIILVPVMGAAMSLFTVGINQHESEQSSIDANQEAQAALEMMTLEIAQAGSHGDWHAVASGEIQPSASDEVVPVDSAAGFTAGDYADVDTGDDHEIVKITGVQGNSFTGAFKAHHNAGKPVRLFALPYLGGVIAPAGLGPNASATTTTLRFFGDTGSNSSLNYVEYVYNSDNAQITRSMTPITQATKNPPLPFVRNVKSNSVQFTLKTDKMGVVTSVGVALTVHNNWSTGSKYKEMTLSSNVAIPSAIAGSVLLDELQTFGGVNYFPSIPTQVSAWATQ